MSELRFSDFKKLENVQFVHCENLFAQNPFLRRINTDSRKIAPNDVFWVLIGERYDAHDFVPAVALSGALCAVVQRAVEMPRPFPQVVVPDTLKALQQFAHLNRQRFNGTIFGLTGSNGKTSTKELIAHLLQGKQTVHKTSGNLNNHIGCPLTLLELNHSFDFAVIEMGTNHPGEIELLARITQPDAALITNLGTAHLEFFKTMDAIAREKLSLFDQMAPGKTIFVNADDPLIAGYQRNDLVRITYGLKGKADVRARIISVDPNGNVRFELNEKVKIQLQVPGEHNVQNALAASAVALFYGLSEAEIKDRLQSYTAFDKRMQVLQHGGLRIINDAYNANPESMAVAFQALQQMEKGGGLILVLGDMFELGEQALQMHKDVLHEALQLNPLAILVMGELMTEAAKSLNAEKIKNFSSHRELAKELKKMAASNSLIFLKGSRGMQMEKVLEFI
ncbi:UDP-N-acetylmuramoyl-tripeptide--D-alanyl-D-alanine ligase [Calditrichota bacterium LG25]